MGCDLERCSSVDLKVHSRHSAGLSQKTSHEDKGNVCTLLRQIFGKKLKSFDKNWWSWRTKWLLSVLNGRSSEAQTLKLSTWQRSALVWEENKNLKVTMMELQNSYVEMEKTATIRALWWQDGSCSLRKIHNNSLGVLVKRSLKGSPPRGNTILSFTETKIELLGLNAERCIWRKPGNIYLLENPIPEVLLIGGRIRLWRATGTIRFSSHQINVQRRVGGKAAQEDVGPEIVSPSNTAMMEFVCVTLFIKKQNEHLVVLILFIAQIFISFEKCVHLHCY